MSTIMPLLKAVIRALQELKILGCADPELKPAQLAHLEHALVRLYLVLSNAMQHKMMRIATRQRMRDALPALQEQHAHAEQILEHARQEHKHAIQAGSGVLLVLEKYFPFPKIVIPLIITVMEMLMKMGYALLPIAAGPAAEEAVEAVEGAAKEAVETAYWLSGSHPLHQHHYRFLQNAKKSGSAIHGAHAPMGR